MLSIVLLIVGPAVLAQDAVSSRQPDWITKVIEAGASTEILERHSPKLIQWHEAIVKHEATALDVNYPAGQMREAVKSLDKIRTELRTFIEELAPKLADAKARFGKLGPAPKEGEPVAEDLVRQRKELGDQVAAFDGLIKRAEVLDVQAAQAISSFNTNRRKRFLSQLLRRSENFSEITFWREAIAAVPAQTGLAITSTMDWLRQHALSSWHVFLFALLGGLVFNLVFSRLCTRVLRADWHATNENPSRAERGTRVLRRSLSVTLPIVAGIAGFILIGSSFDLLAKDEERFAIQSIAYLSVALFLMATAWFAIGTPRREHRVFDLGDRSARWIFWIVSAYILIWFFEQVLALLDKGFYTPLSLIVLRSLCVAVLSAALLGALIAVRIERPSSHPAARLTNGWPRWLFGLIAVFAIVILASAFLGFISFGRFVSAQIVTTGGLLVFVTLTHLTAEYISTPQATSLASDEDDSEPTVVSATVGVIAGLGLDLLVLLVGLPILLLQWGFDWPEVRGWISSAFFGFQIGPLRISVLQVFVAIAIFMAGIVVTQLLRKMFVRRTEQMLASSTGARDSIAAILGYAGTILSLVAALTYLGIELANLALIAGALSIGIGFGLQSIVNNFVSGLILLAERPIKVGDWIILGDKQGRVQKISVRSTQIRSFDRSTLVVPNADLITNPVVNWDLGDSVGRVSINVGVSYDSDPRQVLDILMNIGKSHPGVLVYDRSPRVMFEAFGDSSLDFVLHVHLRNIKDFLDVQTDLRVAIVEAFREANIEIPYPQRDLHFKSSNVGSVIKDPDPTT